MKVAVCTIARLENRYIREYIQYYYDMGVDKIFLYDNNDVDGEDFRDVIGDFIENGFVDLIDFRTGHRFVQVVLDAYTDCYNRNKDDYDFICYFDPDEYIALNEGVSLKGFLSDDLYKDFDAIHVHWKSYSDNGLLEYDSRPLNERFTAPVEPQLFFDDNTRVKSIVRGGIEGVVFNSPHFPLSRNVVINACNTRGEKVLNETKHFNICFDNAFLKHFRCKTITEYMENKLPKLTLKGYNNVGFDSDFFFSFNERTPEKEEIYNRFLEKYLKKDYNKVSLEKTDAKYSVLTCAMGNISSFLFEVEKPVPNVEYVCITNNSKLTSKTWKVVYLPDFQKLPEIARYKFVKFHPFDFVSNDICFYMDMSIKFRGDFFDEKIARPFINSRNDIGFVVHPNRSNVHQEIARWVQHRNLNESVAMRMIELFENEGFEAEGLFFNSFICYRKSIDAKKWCDEVWKILLKFGINGDVSRTDQCLTPFVTYKYFGEEFWDKVFLFNDSIFTSLKFRRFDYVGSRWFKAKNIFNFVNCLGKLIKPYRMVK